jgi:hypothetical protein
MTRELLYLWTSCTLEVLVPKLRGEGFVKVPYGHHADKAMAKIERIAGCDIFGLDGALSFQTGSRTATYPESRDAFTDMLLPALVQHYGEPAREASASEFWSLNPNCATGQSARPDSPRC